MSSYFQKYQRLTNSYNPKNRSNSKMQNKQNENVSNPSRDTRQSYIRAFNKYEISNIMQSKTNQNSQPNDKIFSFNHTRSEYKILQEFSGKKPQRSASKERQKSVNNQRITENRNESLVPKRMSRSNISNIVRNNDLQLEQMLYNSISQVEKQMLQKSEVCDVTRQNMILKMTISKLKSILKQKLEIALKKNKQQLTFMFDEYSAMIKKLLADKQLLTNQLQDYKFLLEKQQSKSLQMEDEYENKIRIIVQTNNEQISNTKSQIQEFLQMIIKYQEQSNKQKTETQQLKQKISNLHIENDMLKHQLYEFQEKKEQFDSFGENLNVYCDKIENLLQIIEQLQSQNEELKRFLNNCQCSKISSKQASHKQLVKYKQESSKPVGQLIESYEKRIIEAERQMLKQSQYNRFVLQKKDQCIDRLNLIIEQFRSSRYDSVDKMKADRMIANQGNFNF